ncbi:MAG: alpha-glucan family phosphorylase [Gammaproteobacteria bacterium]
MQVIEPFLHQTRIAYFSMEIALRSEIPTYAGGLGVLAGDTLRTAADLDMPMVAVSLLSRAGYFRQRLDSEGRQYEAPQDWDPAQWATRLEAMVAVDLGSRVVWVGGWLYILQSHFGGQQPVILLDTDLSENTVEDRSITHYLYGGDDRYRLQQEAILGIGGVRMLQALGFVIRQYHLNEGHSALLGLELLRRYAFPAAALRAGESPYDIPRVRELCNFTTHTPIEAGHDKFAYPLVEEVIDDLIEKPVLHRLGGDDRLNMTLLALNLSGYVNGVAVRHAEVSAKMFPGYRVRAITNGVHPPTWTHKSFARLYDTYLPGWCYEPEILVRADHAIPSEDLWQAHTTAKHELLDYLQQHASADFDAEVITFGFARRMTAYKRPDLLFTDVQRLRSMAQKFPFQLVVAGKAHPRDEAGKQLIQQLHHMAHELRDVVPMVFLPDYNMDLAKRLVAGVDVWLNTPLRPLEASGTSGMKATFNGVPNLSILDGWWIEGCIEGMTGWAIGDGPDGTNDGDAAALYAKLEQVVLPLYYQDRDGWIRVMQGAITKNASYFNSHRMMRRYAAEAYIS